MYGTTLGTEREVINRLDLATEEITHPLLLPGIFVELERARHAKLVKKTGLVLETKMLQLQATNAELKGHVDVKDKQRRNEEKKTAWLDAVYLKNNLMTWKTQLWNAALHSEELDERLPMVCKSYRHARVDSGSTLVPDTGDHHIEERSKAVSKKSLRGGCEKMSARIPRTVGEHNRKCDENRQRFLVHSTSQTLSQQELSLKASRRIRGRMLTIHDEYEDWVRDALMRVEGMAMATQWASGETNFEIALATRRDSKYMRSIAILTMVFLPGTWLAGVFSMSFFDWKSEGDDSPVSIFVWIYVVATFFLTSITVGCWYYVTIYWPRRRRRGCSEQD